MPPRTRSTAPTDRSEDTHANSSSPSTVADTVASPAVAQRRADDALPTVAQLMIEVMRRVTFVGKDQQNTEGGRYNFRGIDDVVNALGPAMRDVGILCLPTVEWAERQLTKTTRGKTTRETIVRIRYTC